MVSSVNAVYRMPQNVPAIMPHGASGRLWCLIGSDTVLRKIVTARLATLIFEGVPQRYVQRKFQIPTLGCYGDFLRYPLQNCR